MSAQTGDQQQVGKGLLITLGVAAAIGVAFALWTFVIQPLTADSGSDPVADAGGAASPEPGASPGPGAATPGAGTATPSPGASPAPGGDGDATQGGQSGADGGPGSPSDGSSSEGGGELGDTVDVVNARDPFQQLVVDSSGGGSGGGSGSGASTTPTTGGSGGGSGDGSGGSGQDQTGVGSTTVTLVDVYTGDDGVQRASVEVDDTGYDVAEGETFADSFQLLDIADTCATMLYGDSRFTLCEGDAVRK